VTLVVLDNPSVSSGLVLDSPYWAQPDVGMGTYPVDLATTRTFSDPARLRGGTTLARARTFTEQAPIRVMTTPAKSRIFTDLARQQGRL